MKIVDESGSGMTELLMVMTLMIFFGLSIYLIIFSCNSVMLKINNEKNAQIEARTALSYINVRIRQFDIADGVAVARNSYNGRDSILLKNRNPGDPDLNYDTWIFWDNGELKEVLSDAGSGPEWEAAVSIAQIEGLKAIEKDGYIISSIMYTYNGEQKSISSSVLLRSSRDGRSI